MKKTQKGFIIPLIIAIVALIAVGGVVYLYNYNIKFGPTPYDIKPADTTSDDSQSTDTTNNNQITADDSTTDSDDDSMVVCTQDAMQCPDGSWVGRTGPNCEFVCPEIITLLKTYRLNESQNLKTDYAPFEIKYPQSWKYKEFSHNTEGIVFCPQDKADCGSLGGGNQVAGTIIVYPYKYDMTGAIAGNSGTHHVFKNTKGEILASISLLDLNYKKVFGEMISSFKFTAPSTDSPPPLGSSTLKIWCGTDSCNTSEVRPTRSNFNVINDGKEVEILIDIETRLRFVITESESGIDTETESIQKWTNFYAHLQPRESVGMPYYFEATIYGDWVNQNTFKANWIKWSGLGY